MADRLSPYRRKVRKDANFVAVCLDEKCQGKDGKKKILAIEVCPDFARMNRCDFYAVVGKGESKELVLIEETKLSLSIDCELRRFKGALDEFSKKLYNADVRSLYEGSGENPIYEMFWDFIFKGLEEEHAAKAQASLLILERMHQRRIDESLSGVFEYAKIYYMLVVEAEEGASAIMLEKILDRIGQRMASTLVNDRCYIEVKGMKSDIGAKLNKAWEELCPEPPLFE